jgi:hypothetical protein
VADQVASDSGRDRADADDPSDPIGRVRPGRLSTGSSNARREEGGVGHDGVGVRVQRVERGGGFDGGGVDG